MSRVRMFVFPFGSGDYDRQCAVVMAETAEDARRLLLADIERQRAACPHRDREESHWCERKGENGFSRGYFTADRLSEAAVAAAEGSGSDMAPFEVVGTVAYTWGVDG